MTPSSFPGRDELEEVKIIFTDIDDTLTRHGYLVPEAFSALWSLNSGGYWVIPVTGRPAGWCDCIVRQWPVKAVIGENGAFACYINDKKQLETFIHPSISGEPVRERLDSLAAAVIAEIPLARIARDQAYRKYDLAIDFAEDPPVLDLDTACRIKKLCERSGAVAKISSIHVNAWFGDYDKLDMVKLFSQKVLGIAPELLQKNAIFCGDSPNDEPMFRFFPLSFGMANIRAFDDIIVDKPAYVASMSHGQGFAEIAGKLLLTSCL